MISEIDLAYLAGVIDSDGCIRVEKFSNHGRSRDGTTYAPHVSIQQVEREAVDLAKAVFGGFLTTVKPPPKRPNARIMFRWTAKSRIALSALLLLRPYLRIKVAQADNAIALANTVSKLNRARYEFAVPGREGPRHRTTQELDSINMFFIESRRLNGGQKYAALQQSRTAQLALPVSNEGDGGNDGSEQAVEWDQSAG